MIETPTRADECFWTNDDRLIEAVWLEPDETPVTPISSATATFQFEMLPPDPATDPPLDPYIVTIEGTDPESPNGFFDAEGFAEGRVALTVRHAAWNGLDTKQTVGGGVWDLLALTDSGARQQVLRRGLFIVVEGVSTQG